MDTPKTPAVRLLTPAGSSAPKPRFYVDPERLSEDRAILLGSAYHHLRNVRRLKPGDEIVVFNGAGREAYGVLESYQGESAVVRVLGDTAAITESSLDLTLVPCLAKGKKTDLVVEKAIELGVNRISVVVSDRSVGRLSEEAALHRVERWRRIAIAAAEQAGRVQMPVVERIQTFGELVSSRPEDALGLVFTAGADPDPPATLRQRYPDTRRVVAIVGPEGGFTREELELARSHGFKDVGLGPRVLRTETAAIVAVAVCQHLWGDLGRRPPSAQRSAI
jgi:16S rRNA (uracil1498-N3)-methyltransferase